MDRIEVRRYAVPDIAPQLRTAHAVMEQYADLEVGLTAATNVALAAAYGTDSVFTLDRRHFRTLRPLTGHDAFRLLPDDV